MVFELIKDATKLALIVAGLYFALGVYVHRKQPAWSEPLEKRRLVIVWVLVLAASAIKVSEDVLGGESGPIDEAILLFIRGHVSGRLTGFFEAITFTGSFRVLFSLATGATIALLCMRRRFEALLLATSVISAATSARRSSSKSGISSSVARLPRARDNSVNQTRLLIW